jgi:predicted dehydrogenase
VDAVVISTPTSTHAPIALAALSAGKHVLCEKPLATTVRDCDALVAAAEKAGRTLMVGHTFLFNPAVVQLRELISGGELGDLLYCHADRTGLGPIREDVNALWDLAPHDVSIVVDLLGSEPVEVSAQGQAYLRDGTEDVVFMTMRFDGGVLAQVHVSWLDPHKVRKLTVVGNRKMVVFDDIAADEKLRVFDKGASYEAMSERARGTEYGAYRAIVRSGDVVIPRIAASEPLKDQVRHFLHCVRTGDQPRSDGRFGRTVTAVLEAASTSLRGGGTPVWLQGRPAEPGLDPSAAHRSAVAGS